MNFNTNPEKPFGYIAREDLTKPEEKQTVHVFKPVDPVLSGRIINCKKNKIKFKNGIDVVDPMNSIESQETSENEGNAMLMRLSECWVTSHNCFDEKGNSIKFPGTEKAIKQIGHNDRIELDQAIVNYSYPGTGFLDSLGSFLGYVEVNILNGIVTVVRKTPTSEKSEGVKKTEK